MRELENVVKRFVILQDEALLLRELQSRRAPRAADRGCAAAPPSRADRHRGCRADGDRRPPANARRGRRELPPAAAGRQTAPASSPPAGPQSLARSRRAWRCCKAERDLIVPTLRRVHWNRRKAAPLLGISYKTLLNKIKEHGIVQDSELMRMWVITYTRV